MNFIKNCLPMPCKPSILPFLGFFVLCNLYILKAQVTGNAPYTGIGVGDLYNGAFAHQAGMGGSSVSYSPVYFINGQNPALLAGRNNLIFEVGMGGQYKQIQSNVQSQLDLGGGLLYMSILIPVTPRWVTNIGIAPYSFVNYENRFRQKIANSDFSADYIFKGAGGIGSVYWANGYQLNQYTSIGLKASYLYGTTSQEASTRLFTNTTLDYKVTLNEKISYSGALLEPALSLKIPLAQERFFNIGAVYALETNIGTRKSAILEQRNIDDTFIFGNTLQNDAQGRTLLPAKYSLGISVEHQYRWAIVADASWQDWRKFYNFNAPQPLAQAFSANIGGEFVPDYSALTGYFKRVIYRAGLNYTQTPIQIQGTAINDLSAHWGFSMPVARNASLLNFAFALGQRGVISNELVRERYLRFSFGVSINDRRFQRRRID